MKIGFVIISYGSNYLENCVESIRLLYDFPIFIIDNKMDGEDEIIINNVIINKYNDIHYTKNI